MDDVTFPTIELSDSLYEHEGLRFATVKSPALGRRADVSVWVPPAESVGTLLILLHGVYGSHWVWSHKAGVHRAAQRLLTAGDIAPMVIAMPSDGLGRDGSGYLTWPPTSPGAEDVERWIVDEVPAIARLAAPGLVPDAKIAIAGLSMGGYAALRLGAKYAPRFSAICAHSSITDIREMEKFAEEPLAEYLACAPALELSPMFWLQRNRGILPPIRFDCGVEDDLLGGNRHLHRALEEQKIAHEYAEFSGAHEWTYWQRHIPKTLRFVSRICARST